MGIFRHAGQDAEELEGYSPLLLPPTKRSHHPHLIITNIPVTSVYSFSQTFLHTQILPFLGDYNKHK